MTAEFRMFFDNTPATDQQLDLFRTTLARPDCPYPASLALISVWGRRRLS